MDFTLFQKLASDDFAVISLGQYARSKRIAYQSAMNLIQSCINADSADEVEHLINMVDDFNVESNIIIDDASDSIANIARKAFILSEMYSGTDTQDPTGNASTEILVKIGSISLSKLADVMQADLNSIACLESACEVFPLGDPNTQLNYFKDKLADTFNNNFTAVSSSYQIYRSFFEKKLSASQFLQSVGAMMGLNDVDDTDLDEGIISRLQNSNFNQYTGASPAGPLCFDTVNNAVNSATKIAVQGLNGVMSGLYKCAKSIFSKVKSKVVQTISDPDDLYEIEGDGEYCENFGISIDEDLVIPLPDSVDVTRMILALDGSFNKWLYYDTKFFTMQMRLDPERTGYFQGSSLNCRIQAVIRPKVVKGGLSSIIQNHFNLNDSSSGYWNGNSNSGYDYANFLDDISANILYADNQSSEKGKASGMCDALSVGASCMQQAFDILVFDDDLSITSDPLYTKSHAIPDTVTNATFFYLATGINGNNTSATYQEAGFGNTGGGTNSVKDFAIQIVKSFALGFMCHKYDKLMNSTSYSWFPYAEEYNPPVGKWDIKTDAANIQAFNTFGVTAVLVVIAVVSAIVIGVAAKKISRSAFFKRKALTSQLDNKMWSGQKLTKTEKRKYLRATRKLEASSLISSGLATSTSTDISVSNSNSTLEAISNVSSLIL